MATRIPYAFGVSGDTSTVPDTSSGTELSWQQGWSSAYELASTETGYRYIDRGQHNYLWNAVTANIKEWQEQAFPTFQSDVAYSLYAQVYYSGNYYVCTAATTAGILPTNTSYWTLFSDYYASQSFASNADNLTSGTVDSDRLPNGTLLTQVTTGVEVTDTTTADSLPFGAIKFSTALVPGTVTTISFDGIKIGSGTSYKIIAASYGGAGYHVLGLYTRSDDTWVRLPTKSYVDNQDAATLASAESYASDADNLTSGTVDSARLPSGVVPSFGSGQTRTTYTVGTDRILGTTYTNSSTRPRFIQLFFGNGSTTGDVTITINGTVWINAEEVDVLNDLSNFSMCLIILPSETYAIDYTGDGNLYWQEIQ